MLNVKKFHDVYSFFVLRNCEQKYKMNWKMVDFDRYAMWRLNEKKEEKKFKNSSLKREKNKRENPQSRAQSRAQWTQIRIDEATTATASLHCISFRLFFSLFLAVATATCSLLYRKYKSAQRISNDWRSCMQVGGRQPAVSQISVATALFSLEIIYLIISIILVLVASHFYSLHHRDLVFYSHKIS